MKNTTHAVLNLITLFLITCTLALSPAQAEHIPSPPHVHATSWILIDFASGKTLAEGNADVKVAPASLTKIMTSYVVGEALNSSKIALTDSVTVDKDAWASGNPALRGSSVMFLKPADRVTVEKLNKGIIIQSGNDACIAMADYIAGSQDSFISLMNGYATRLDLKNTVFKTVHGLSHPGEYTTARDMALLASALIRNTPDQYAIHKERSFRYNHITQYNRNRLLRGSSLHVDGIKTGTTGDGGFNFVTSATHNGMRLIAVILDAKSDSARFLEAEQLLAWGFRYYETYTPLPSDRVFITRRVWLGDKKSTGINAGNNGSIVVPKGKLKQIKTHYFIDNDEILAPVMKGQTVGKVVFKIDDTLVDEKPLIAMESVSEGGVVRRLWDYTLLKINSWTHLCLSCDRSA